MKDVVAASFNNLAYNWYLKRIKMLYPIFVAGAKCNQIVQ